MSKKDSFALVDKHIGIGFLSSAVNVPKYDICACAKVVISDGVFARFRFRFHHPGIPSHFPIFSSEWQD